MSLGKTVIVGGVFFAVFRVFPTLATCDKAALPTATLCGWRGRMHGVVRSLGSKLMPCVHTINAPLAWQSRRWRRSHAANRHP